jgi:hypothetical protein
MCGCGRARKFARGEVRLGMSRISNGMWSVHGSGIRATHVTGLSALARFR